MANWTILYQLSGSIGITSQQPLPDGTSFQFYRTLESIDLSVEEQKYTLHWMHEQLLDDRWKHNLLTDRISGDLSTALSVVDPSRLPKDNALVEQQVDSGLELELESLVFEGFKVDR